MNTQSKARLSTSGSPDIWAAFASSELVAVAVLGTPRLSLSTHRRAPRLTLSAAAHGGRYEHVSQVLTSNLALVTWDKAASVARVASMIIDTIVHHVDVLKLANCSNRLRIKTWAQLQAQ